MTKEEFYKELNYVNHSREKRIYYAQMVIAQPELVPTLLEILFDVNDKVSCRAAWVLEFLCSENLEALIPFLDTFTESMHLVHQDSAVRPIAKICEFLASAYFSKEPNKIQKVLTASHKERIIEVCFDYMINDEKIAPKAYSMNTLYLFGLEYDWIHPELASIIQKDIYGQSAGYKARGKKILKKIKAS
ncbi:adenylosuccinate lyase [Mangrovimonas futianensis]|uniref:adenylosuccinate lyase n=1 Tax=Mangrovimonas futianensis TaxID=2895523 RepID=UPI001E386950|nr:adenylosuccinate lyase [Mangrovimonas futianensis]